ncbi:MAG: DUF2920 family protein, partial [Planctomycetes bacterium]|nr:DUF2920 family protein [Planctomycetota bacterium]
FFFFLFAFDEMGIMQALDNITAVRAISDRLESQKVSFNKNKIFVFGNSHGAYLSYLCNGLAPGLFSLLIDSSAYLNPEFLNRSFHFSIDGVDVAMGWPKLLTQINRDSEICNIESFYSSITNTAHIVAFHGVDDKFLPSSHKKQFCGSVPHCIFNEITEDKVDGKIFKSTEHGAAHYTRLFTHALEDFSLSFDGHQGELRPFKHQTKLYDYHIDYSNAVPDFQATSLTDQKLYHLSRIKIGT